MATANSHFGEAVEPGNEKYWKMWVEVVWLMGCTWVSRKTFCDVSTQLNVKGWYATQNLHNAYLIKTSTVGTLYQE